MAEKVVLAYSGGLDTSVAIKWIAETYDCEVIALAIDIGMEKDYPSIQKRGLDVGAVKSLVIDARETFAKEFVFPALQANALYEGEYPLATALARPLIAKLLVDTAHQEGATAVAHGCTGKGNDQVRFDVSINALDPKLKIIAPAREWGMTREEEIAYAKKHGIPIPDDVPLDPGRFGFFPRECLDFPDAGEVVIECGIEISQVFLPFTECRPHSQRHGAHRPHNKRHRNQRQQHEICVDTGQYDRYTDQPQHVHQRVRYRMGDERLKHIRVIHHS